MTAYWTTLSHRGVAVPAVYQPKGLRLKLGGREVEMNPLAEEMAYHFAKKKDTPYVKDPVFVANFMTDFAKQLPDWCRDARYDEFDFSEFYSQVDREKKERETMNRERKKSDSAGRKALRDQLKAEFGFAVLDGNRVEIANWMVEPPGLFMGRGAHPLRGHWKPRVTRGDIILNLGEKSSAQEGDWKQVVHDHNSMWIAKWIDKLTDKEKYVWLHESTPIVQFRNKAKYDSAMKVGIHLERIRNKILKQLSSRDKTIRQTATVCYLIDWLGMRVGDEKEEDEADTVGASTLRVEHVKIDGDKIEFDFLGKDSVRWSKTIMAPPPPLLKNLRDFTAGKKPGDLVFDHVNSSTVNRFFSGIVSGLSAKVFRTYHATFVAEDFLKKARVTTNKDDVYKLYQARVANLEAAKFCNHQRTVPMNWEESLEKKKARLTELRKSGKKDDNRMHKLTLDIDLQERTRNYNLNTSLKNYIDPRVYKSWCDYVGLEWTKIYTASMQRKFAWVARAKAKWEPEAGEAIQVAPQSS
ncbi:MAG: DNA topoisomerase I [Thaumarchaeota archaeon]|nr:DNA topoisomerase I [Nitrososphaerota archaeon]